jgi:hypothetical protein
MQKRYHPGLQLNQKQSDGSNMDKLHMKYSDIENQCIFKMILFSLLHLYFLNLVIMWEFLFSHPV